MYLEYNLYIPLSTIDLGIENSRIATCPPTRVTRYISAKPFFRSSKFLTPKATVTASNVPVSNFRDSLSPCSRVITSDKPIFSILSLPISNILLLRSIPVIDFGLSCLAVIIATSPVPVATSRIFCGLSAAIILIIFFLQPRSIPRVNTWFNRS